MYPNEGHILVIRYDDYSWEETVLQCRPKPFASQNDLYLCQRDGVIFCTLVAKHNVVSMTKEWLKIKENYFILSNSGILRKVLPNALKI